MPTTMAASLTFNLVKADYYRALQVDPAAEGDVIEKAFKTLAKKYHPDTAGAATPEAHSRMQLLNEAYAILSDPERRQTYDRERKQRLWEVFLEDGLIGVYRDLSRG